jgi:signal transduction histidine kinase
MGYLLVSRMFLPISKFAHVVDEVDLERLDNTITIEGHKDDELVILGDKFNEMLLRLKTMSQQQKEFLSNVSHELKTPLTRAISTLEVLSPNDADYENEILNVKRDLFDITNLLEKLLFLSRLRKDSVIKNDNISVKGLVVYIYDKLEPEFKGKDIILENLITDGVYLNMPREYADVLFTNLISNSIKYSLEHTKVVVSADKDKNGKLIIKITDNGIGMSQEEIDKIFERFYRGIDGKKLSSGSGIGLSIVKRICDLYNINVQVTSEKNKGTTFALTFS